MKCIHCGLSIAKCALTGRYYHPVYETQNGGFSCRQTPEGEPFAEPKFATPPFRHEEWGKP